MRYIVDNPGATSTGHTVKKNAETEARKALNRGNRSVTVRDIETGKRGFPYLSGAVVKFRYSF